MGDSLCWGCEKNRKGRKWKSEGSTEKPKRHKRRWQSVRVLGLKRGRRERAGGRLWLGTILNPPHLFWSTCYPRLLNSCFFTRLNAAMICWHLSNTFLSNKVSAFSVCPSTHSAEWSVNMQHVWAAARLGVTFQMAKVLEERLIFGCSKHTVG